MKVKEESTTNQSNQLPHPFHKSGYPLVIKHGNGKSHMDGGSNRKSLIFIVHLPASHALPEGRLRPPNHRNPIDISAFFSSRQASFLGRKAGSEVPPFSAWKPQASLWRPVGPDLVKDLCHAQNHGKSQLHSYDSTYSTWRIGEYY